MSADRLVFPKFTVEVLRAHRSSSLSGPWDLVQGVLGECLMNGWTEGWTHGWMDGWLDRQMDG